MAKVYLGLGSNIGDKEQNLKQAIKLLQEHKQIKLMKKSSIYVTDPVGYTDQDVFYNQVIEVESDLEPYDLLAYVNEVEEILKRKRLIRWGPRTIDIDILLYDEYISQDEKLTIPHPRMTERAFVMVPLFELTQDVKINGKDIKVIYEAIDKNGAKKKV
ncbi:2-amino-4-hydroxy-6-hydroxymethyldihydropteridine diphosphokinase [Natranaerovirga pectinivora]|uniref:2-amino-4-hydroxy-6-hydroxymethyldihydropteridine diphosphokinase n=1 Tax=Natranaerovirga pectinivora TaxID=682400 RepID=A0A4R3MIY7_9FIRM|nr:2-amino-4-hydroxy-6-hydroxymethyldihydropteridine diphosphokinase [Natranaerovirga pectinivora]TCT13973.1 2-amino-4-hydroxy-6-hydroxymethyldihydropteridine diphosphokinase [Natranaerovirga pectinivora]